MAGQWKELEVLVVPVFVTVFSLTLHGRYELLGKTAMLAA